MVTTISMPRAPCYACGGTSGVPSRSAARLQRSASGTAASSKPSKPSSARRSSGHEHRIAEINEFFCDPTFFERTPHKEVAKLEREQKELTARIEEQTARWEVIEEQIADSGVESA